MVGMGEPPGRTGGGLGTSIVSALAHQLKADITVEDNHPGTLVSIVHDGGSSEAATDTVPAV